MTLRSTSDRLGSFEVPRKNAIRAIVNYWAAVHPGWKETSADYRHAKSLLKDLDGDVEAAMAVIDAGLRKCDTDRFWAQNRTLRFIVSRVDELLNLGGGDGREYEAEHEDWVRNVQIPLFRLEDREGPVRLGRRLLGSYERLRAVLDAIYLENPHIDDAALAKVIKDAAERDAGPGRDAD